MTPPKTQNEFRLRHLGETDEEYHAAVSGSPKVRPTKGAPKVPDFLNREPAKVKTRATKTAKATAKAAAKVDPEADPTASQDKAKPAPVRVAPVILSLEGEPSVGDDGRLRPLLRDPGLAIAAEILNDLERGRIANENRLRTMTSSGPDEDGVVRGWGLSPEHPQVLPVVELVENLARLEATAVKNLQKAMRRHPLGAWGKLQRGVGEKQLARLLSAIGDPYVHDRDGRHRSVSELWAYSGYHVIFSTGQAGDDAPEDRADGEQVPGDLDAQETHTETVSGELVGLAARRRRGQRANWSPGAKMRAYLIAESCLKQIDADCKEFGHEFEETPDGGPEADGTHVAVPPVQVCKCSPYRVKYDLRKEHTRVTRPDWTDGHRHNDALRIAAKEILKHLWVAARDWHVNNGFDPDVFQPPPPVVIE